MMKQLKIAMLSGLWLLGSCIGTDYQDDPIVGERIEIDLERLALRKNETKKLTATFYDQYGLPATASLVWTSSNASIVAVDANGFITGLSAGQAMVIASVGATQSKSVEVNVVLDDTRVATVEVVSPGQKKSLAILEKHQLQAMVKNINGELLTGKTIQWFSENSAIATVADGWVTGVSQGIVDIHAKVDGVKSNVINFSIGSGRTGTFVSAGGYRAVGMATLRISDGKLMLELSNNFETSFALGTYVYLANTTNGSQVRSSGLEIAQITTNGAKTFNVSAIKPDVKITDYNYVIILCKPASVTFGFALLN